MKDLIKLGIIGCSENTHGKMWAELLRRPEYKKLGMIPAFLWDSNKEDASQLAKATDSICVNSPIEVGEKADGILITELYPERYLELSRPFLEKGKYIFFNRPFAGNMTDASEIIRLAKKYQAKIYSASALFHTKAADNTVKKISDIGDIRLFSVTGPTDNFYWYLPHIIAAMVSILGTGVETIQTITPKNLCNQYNLPSPCIISVVYGSQSKIGKVKGIMSMTGPDTSWYGFRMKIFGSKKEMDEIIFDVSYDLLLKEMANFFQSGEEPISYEVILEKTAIFYAALLSLKQKGRIITLSDIYNNSYSQSN